MSPCVHPHCGGQEPTTLSRTPPTAFPRPPPWLSWRSPRPAAGAGPHLSGLGAGAEGEHLPKPEWRWPSSPGGLGLSCWSDGHTRESPPAPTPALCLCSRAFSVLLEPQPSSDMAALRGVGSSPTSWLKRITDVCVTDGPRAGTTPSLPQVPWIPGKIQRPGGSVPHMCPWGGRVSTQGAAAPCLSPWHPAQSRPVGGPRGHGWPRVPGQHRGPCRDISFSRVVPPGREVRAECSVILFALPTENCREGERQTPFRLGQQRASQRLM